MPIKIDWTVSVIVQGGPKVPVKATVTVSAYDQVHVTIPAKNGGPGKATVSVLTSDLATMKFLLITSSVYSDKLKYKVKGSGDTIVLDQPQLLAGAGLAGVLGSADEEFEFTNDVDPAVAAQVEILVGRDD